MSESRKKPFNWMFLFWVIIGFLTLALFAQTIL